MGDRRLWHDRHHNTLSATQLNEASGIIAQAGHHATSARADRRIIALGRRLDVPIGVRLAERAIERDEHHWFDTMNHTLDAIAVERYGTVATEKGEQQCWRWVHPSPHAKYFDVPSESIRSWNFPEKCVTH